MKRDFTLASNSLLVPGRIQAGNGDTQGHGIGLFYRNPTAYSHVRSWGRGMRARRGAGGSAVHQRGRPGGAAAAQGSAASHLAPAGGPCARLGIRAPSPEELLGAHQQGVGTGRDLRAPLRPSTPAPDGPQTSERPGLQPGTTQARGCWEM